MYKLVELMNCSMEMDTIEKFKEFEEKITYRSLYNKGASIIGE